MMLGMKRPPGVLSPPFMTMKSRYVGHRMMRLRRVK